MSKIMRNDIQYSGVTPEKDFSDLIDFFYPIGCYFETSDASFDPNVEWSGYWELETEGRVHISSGSNYTIGTMDGRKDAIVPSHDHPFTHPRVTGGSCTIGSSGYHSHGIPRTANYAAGGSNRYAAQGNDGSTTSGGEHTHTVPDHEHSVWGGSVGYAGESDATVVANANMMPYIVINRWHRTA